MKHMKFFNSEKNQFSEKDFQTSRKKSSKSSNILIFPIFVTNYNWLHQSISWSAIEILIKINLKKAWKLISHFLVLLGKFHELHDDLKIIWKMLTPGNLKNMIFTFEIRSPKTVENIPTSKIKRIFFGFFWKLEKNMLILQKIFVSIKSITFFTKVLQAKK